MSRLSRLSRMSRLSRLALLLGLALLCLVTRAADVPYLSGRVVDNAEVLKAETRVRLTRELEAHEHETGNQIAVLTVPTLEGESVETYAEQVFNAWHLGQKGKDNGVLVLVAPSERRMRIEVGYGLESVLPDLVAGRIIRQVMTPRFKQGDFNAGIEEGVAAIIGQISGTAQALADVPAAAEEESESVFKGPDLPLTERILFGAFIFGVIGVFTLVGVITPGMGWFLYFFLIPFWALFPIIVVGTKGALYLLGTYVVGFPLAKLMVSRSAWYHKARQDMKTKGSAEIGGLTLRSGSSGSSWSSGSSSSGGGFSGGGGSSGGGGASGSW